MSTKKVVRNILVTGGNAGIGLALCRQLAVDKGCHVYMGTRSRERGEKGLKEITEKYPHALVDLVEIDVGKDESVHAAAKSLKSKGVTLYALVNNAAVGFAVKTSREELINTNFLGPKRVSEAFVDLIDPKEGRIVNVSSGAASGWLRDQSAKIKDMFSSLDTSWDDLKKSVLSLAPTSTQNGYGLSKAALCCYTMQQGKKWPNLKCTSLTPGFIQTKMTANMGATKKPDEATVSYMRCLFGDVRSGHYYGSDGLRSPLTVCRDPGTPEYGGEKSPDPRKYNR
eukprot:g200.t1